jgi:hypothetical protein
MADIGADPAFRVSGFDHFLTGLIANHRQFWIRLGNLETKILADEIAPVRIEAPIYVAGLARAGTTIALEILASHPDVATHLYRDFPPVFTPYWWNWFVERSRKGPLQPQERAHKDGIMITADSPEAREEVIWMAFFDHLHDPGQSNVLGRETQNPAFERFYSEHIRKLLAARGKRRYLSKGNYNVTRIAYLHKLFPDARFVIPVRDPVWHIASLMKQHRLFCEGERGNDRALDYMRRVGHFEFGLDLRPINCGNTEMVREIEELWQNGEEVRGWARYWAMVYGHVAETLEANPALREATMILRYEDLCDKPEETMRRMMEHCGLEVDESVICKFADRLLLPDYYQPAHCASDVASIVEVTDHVRMQLSL